jgi:hypothetical protein
VGIEAEFAATVQATEPGKKSQEGLGKKEIQKKVAIALCHLRHRKNYHEGKGCGAASAREGRNCIRGTKGTEEQCSVGKGS